MIKKPIVITNGQLEQLQVGDVLVHAPNTFEATNGESISILIGGTVYISGVNTIKYAKADSDATKTAIAMCTNDIVSGEDGVVQVNGRLTLTTVQWDLVTGDTGGLIPGISYFLSEITSGRISKIAPNTGFVVKIGIAVSTIDFEISISAPIKL